MINGRRKKGFVLLEAVIMFLVLVLALLFFYIAANNIIVKEKEYSYYEDVASIYSAYYVKEALKNYSNVSTFLSSALFTNYYGTVVGTETSGFFKNTTSINSFYLIADKLNLYQIYVTNNITSLKSCANNVNMDTKCKNTYMDERLRSYIKTINTKNISSTYYLILEFRKDISGNTCAKETCYSYFTWVAL